MTSIGIGIDIPKFGSGFFKPPSSLSPSDAAILAIGSLRFWGQSDNPANTIDSSGTPSYSQWADKSGLTHNVAQSTKALQPQQVAAVQNGYPGLFFDGTMYLDFVSGALDICRNVTGYSAFFVVVPTLPPAGTGTVYQCSANGAAGSNRIANYIANTGAQGIAVRRADGDSQSNRSGGTLVTATPYILSYIYDIPSQSCYLYANDTLMTSLEGSFGSAGAATSDTDSARASIGALNAGSFYRGYILEASIHAKVVTAGERASVVSALNGKYLIY